jgi:hypothetical protein
MAVKLNDENDALSTLDLIKRQQKLGASPLLPRPVPDPLRKIQCLPSPIYVRNHQPRNWSHVAIPGPYATIGMTIIAGTLKNGSHSCIYREMCVQFALGIDRRISSGRLKELNCHQNKHEQNSKSF